MEGSDRQNRNKKAGILRRSGRIRVLCMLLSCLMIAAQPANAALLPAETAGTSGQNGFLKNISASEASRTEKTLTGWRTENGKKYYYKNGRRYTGWLEENSSRYYLKAGRKLTGWQKIGGKQYHFKKNGVLITNQITKGRKGGYCYVDKTGALVKDPNIRYAVKFVMTHAGLKGSARSRLKKCYLALWEYTYYSNNYKKPTAKRIAGYASFMFQKHAGDCYNYAATMAYIARVLGYSVRMGAGGVTAHAGWPLSEHGLTIVRDDGFWKIIDCSMGRRHTDDNCFMVKRSEYPFRLSIERVFGMKVENGTVKWVRK